MPNFSISNNPREPDAPSGEYDYTFYRPKTDEEEVIPADSRDEAWEGIYYRKDSTWWTWILHGREGIDYTEVSTSYAARNPKKAEKWGEPE